jgi:transcriptional regulator GlxA family with amidase domain
VEVLRAALRPGGGAGAGWLSALADPRLQPALRLMHDQPERDWGLVELARATAMSRTRFATRFRNSAGRPPVACLTRWRMQLAQRALRETGTTVAALAVQLGTAR